MAYHQGYPMIGTPNCSLCLLPQVEEKNSALQRRLIDVEYPEAFGILSHQNHQLILL